MRKVLKYERLVFSLIFSVSALSFYAQQQARIFYRVALSRCNTYLVATSQSNGAKGLGATGFYAELGGQLPFVSSNKLRLSFRYGYERKRFEKEQAEDVYFFYYLRNHSLALCTEAATPLSKTLDFTAGLNFAYIIASRDTGGGQRSSGYTYTFALEDNRNIIDTRPHLGLEWHYNKKKNSALFIEGALSLVARNAALKDGFISANFPEKYYSITYSTLFFSAGLRF